MDLPLEDREMLTEWAEVGPRSDNLEDKKAASKKIAKYLSGFLKMRSLTPGVDLISRIAQAEIDGDRWCGARFSCGS